jgi:hypothetical protein
LSSLGTMSNQKDLLRRTEHEMGWRTCDKHLLREAGHG